eukprot:g30575.t1
MEKEYAAKVRTLVDESDIMLDEHAKAALKAVPGYQGLQVFHHVVQDTQGSIRTGKSCANHACAFHAKPLLAVMCCLLVPAKASWLLASKSTRIGDHQITNRLPLNTYHHPRVASIECLRRNPSAFVVKKCREIAKQNGTESHACETREGQPAPIAARPEAERPEAPREASSGPALGGWRSMPLDQWLRSVDNGKGYLLQYEQGLLKNYDNLEQIMELYVAPPGDDGKISIDQILGSKISKLPKRGASGGLRFSTFFADLTAGSNVEMKVGHKRMFEKCACALRSHEHIPVSWRYATPHQHHAAALEPWNKNVRSELAEWQVFHAERASKVDESGLFLCEQMRVCRKLHKSKSCVGVSCRMQEMYALVFIFRYLDLLWSYISVYNTVMKVVFITATIYLIYLMRVKPPISQTYERSTDKFQYEIYLLGPCFLLGILCTEEYSVAEVLWTTSIWLESVAIVPQLVLLQQMREVENLTSQFVATMGAYRALYILNWIYRYFADDYVNWVGWVGGLVQTVLYADFFYYYARSKWYGGKLVLPVAT